MSKIAKSMAVLGVVAGLGVAALPLSSYAVESNEVTVRATIESAIAVTAADDLVDLGNIIGNGPIAEKKTRVTVTTNNSDGYTLKIKDADNDTSMNSLSGQMDKIAAGTPAVGTTAWGVKGGKIADYTGVTAAGLELAVVTTATGTTDDPTNGVTEVTFGVSADDTLAAGVYEDTVVFVAEANAVTEP